MSPAAKPILPATLSEAHGMITQLHWQVWQLKKQLYGPTADRAPEPESYASEQGLLSIFPPRSEPPATEEVVLPEAPAEETKPARACRQPVTGPVETVTTRLEPEEKTCPHCGKEKCEIGCERTERFEYIPARLIRQITERPKLACPCGQGVVSIAPLPPAPIEKGQPGPGLLAQVVLGKYEDHNPLYRQHQQFARLGVTIPRSTLGDWIENAAELLQPIVRAMKEELLAGDYLQVDETPVKLMDPETKGKCATGYLWVAGRPGGDVIFEFKTRRNKECALELLGDFAGILQRDGYGVYGSVARDRPRIKESGCLAHGRRKFVDALADEPKEAEWWVAQIRKLYLIEQYARDQQMNSDQRLALRQERSVPIWGEMTARLEELKTREPFLPQSPTSKALTYARNEWAVWQVYLANGAIEIDNNLTENAIRPSAVGKKNWLFIGHPDAGWRSATIYSVLVSCRRRGINTWEYLRDLFDRLPGATNQQITDFTPAAWQKLRAATNHD